MLYSAKKNAIDYLILLRFETKTIQTYDIQLLS